jgi:hypothetical protein
MELNDTSLALHDQSLALHDPNFMPANYLMKVKVARDPNFRQPNLEHIKTAALLEKAWKEAATAESKTENNESFNGSKAATANNKTENKKQQYFQHLYFNPEYGAGYSGIKKIWARYKYEKEKYLGIPTIKYKEMKLFLEDQSTYQLHKPSKKKFTLRKTMASYVDQ